MKIIGIETSCDETASAIVEDGVNVLSNNITSSLKLHQITGGIIPEKAAREQLKLIIPVIIKTLDNQSNNKKTKQLSDTKIILDNIDAIAVTIGPGLIGSLLVGVETAKTLSYLFGIPLIPVNHVVAHLYANWFKSNQPEFPAIGLVASGGHTELFYMQNHQKIKWIGGTLDDACGEAFDKTARLLDLGFPGGPAIAKEAIKFSMINNHFPIKLPRPMINNTNLNFSFSGLKTAVMHEVNKFKTNKLWSNEITTKLAYEIQEAITDVLVAKTLKAAKQFKTKSVLLGGGVAANKRLTEKFQLLSSTYNLQIFIPPPPLCTDNATYIASYAYFHFNPQPWQNIHAKPDLEVDFKKA